MHNETEKKTGNKPGADYVLETTDRDPHGALIYHPSMLRWTVIGAIIGGVILAFVAWMVTDGAWSIVGLGQMASGNRGPGAFLGFVIGSGVGGLLGGIMAIRKVLR